SQHLGEVRASGPGTSSSRPENVPASVVCPPRCARRARRSPAARPSCSGTGRAGHCGNGHGSPLCPETDAVDNHRPFQEKPGLTGKRELPPEDAARPGSFARPMSEDAVVRTIIEFLTFLRLKGM
ncbi:galanin peptides, partial [Suricata suricatta]|uniref:galanin peptides n=1 Tax=Suricata suricatta TaxID=37032 RepID=UPI001155CF19